MGGVERVWEDGLPQADQSTILLTAITLKQLYKHGYESMLGHYLKVAPKFIEPSAAADGERASPCRFPAGRATRLCVRATVSTTIRHSILAVGLFKVIFVFKVLNESDSLLFQCSNTFLLTLSHTPVSK